jgi:hypothetical protein
VYVCLSVCECVRVCVCARSSLDVILAIKSRMMRLIKHVVRLGTGEIAKARIVYDGKPKGKKTFRRN